MNAPVLIDTIGLGQLIKLLQKKGYQVMGPTVRDEAIVYDTLDSINDLPQGWTDEQEAGHYRIKKRDDNAYFGYVVGPHSWKKYLHPPRRRLWRAEQKDGEVDIIPESAESTRFAFLGVRSCELHAITIQDEVFIKGPHVDNDYRLRRENALIIAVNCTQSAPTCFCVSMNTGPKAESGYDLVLTEILENNIHHFLVQAGSEKGLELLGELDPRPAKESDISKAEKGIEQAAQQMSRSMKTDGIKELLFENLEHPRWDEVAERCLSCANCTMVCPTCFCSTVEDVTDITGDHAERWQRWDSCFTMDFSYLHGGSVRSSTKSRYRQWMTHKLASWIDQFGSSGCVGCGRCVTWCPVGIDITEEVRAIENAGSKTSTPSQGGKE